MMHAQTHIMNSSLKHRKGKAKMYDQRGRWRCVCLSDFRAVFSFLGGGDYFSFINGGSCWLGLYMAFFFFFFIVREAVLLRFVVL